MSTDRTPRAREIANWMIRYYPSVRIHDYPWVYRDCYHEQLPKKNPCDELGHKRMGNMGVAQFDVLKDDIAEHGIENPFIIEYYCKDLPNAKGLRDAPVLAIRTGNNRAECMRQLKISYAPALFVVPRTQVAKLPTAHHIVIPINRWLEKEVCKLWKEVVRGDDEPIGVVGAWRDSVLLTDIIRESKDVEG